MNKDYEFEIFDIDLVNKINNKIILTIDINVWIDLVEKESILIDDINKTLLDLVNKGKIICPITSANLWELYKQDYDSMIRISYLMEKLSLNVFYRSSNQVYSEEIKNYLTNFLKKDFSNTLPLERVFGPFLSHISSHAALKYPESNVDNNVVTSTNKFVEAMSSKITLSQYINLCKNFNIDLKKVNNTPTVFNLNLKDTWNFTKGNKEKIRRIEEEWVIKNKILPKLNKYRSLLLPLIKLEFDEHLKSLSKNKYGGVSDHILKYMPAIKNGIDVYTVVSYNPDRKSRQNDFFDIELLEVPLAYSNYLVSQDGWIRELLTKNKYLLDQNNCKLISNISDFYEELKILEN